MLRERDGWPPVTRGYSQKSRTRRQLLLCSMLPAVLLASFFVSAIFTVGHLGQRARAAMVRREHALQRLIDDERRKGGRVFRPAVHLNGASFAAGGAQLLQQGGSTRALANDTPTPSLSSAGQPSQQQQLLPRRHREERAAQLEQHEDVPPQTQEQRRMQAQAPPERRGSSSAAMERKASAAAVLSPR